MDDWRVQLSKDINEKLRSERYGSFLFNMALPYVDAETGELVEAVAMMGLEASSTEAKVFLMAPEYESVAELPESLDDKALYSVERLLLWADL